MIVKFPLRRELPKKDKGVEFVKCDLLDLKLNEIVHNIIQEHRASKQKQTILEEMCKREDKKIVDSIFAKLLYSTNISFSFTDNPLLEVMKNLIFISLLLFLIMNLHLKIRSIKRRWLDMEEVTNHRLNIF